MYEEVGKYSGCARELANLAGSLSPERKPEGYATTDCDRTLALYFPLLSITFPGEWKQCFLAILWANGTIPIHQDGDTQDGKSERYHLVLQSNQWSWTLHDGCWQQLEEGGIYRMNPVKTHAAVNWGGEPRIHFVVDIKK